MKKYFVLVLVLVALFSGLCVLYNVFKKPKKKVLPAFKIEGEIISVGRYSQGSYYSSSDEVETQELKRIIDSLYKNVTNVKVTQGIEGGMDLDFKTNKGNSYSLTCVGNGCAIYSEEYDEIVYFEMEGTEFKDIEKLFLKLPNKKYKK